MDLLSYRQKRTLERIDALLSGWSVDWVLVDRYALLTRGYRVKELKRHINLLVDSSRLSWIARARRQAVPPAGSRYHEEYSKFLKSEPPLHLIPYPFNQLGDIYFSYMLPNRRTIKVGKPVEGVRFFGDLLKTLGIEELGGEYKVAEWLGKIEHWRQVAEKCKDEEFSKACEEVIVTVKAHFGLN